ncbi:MAG: acyl-phosphate glycerol 3-phosphate acyltransferase [Chloroflexi bacterium RBG_16_50_9]|nr:MAG: acyl-phosphate glycerol 3-phosphate acyltransferase [Chloroflexi bacterium RBG_16_50_9]
MTIANYAAVVLAGYLIGSIPFGLLVSLMTSGADLRQVGSGKTGTTNVLRTAGKKAAALALILDMAKGALPVLLARLVFNGDYHIAQLLAGLSVIAGHSWSVFLKFKGGRGVATFLGGMLAMYWPAAIFGGAIMIIVAYVSKYMSLGSITGSVAASAMLVILYILKSYPTEYLIYTIYTLSVAIFIFIMHRDNVIRLVNGKERKLGDKVKTSNSLPTINPE